jgi:hypothetical protein
MEYNPFKTRVDWKFKNWGVIAVRHLEVTVKYSMININNSLEED